MMAYKSGQHRRDSNPQGEYTEEKYGENDSIMEEEENTVYNDEQINILQVMSSMNKTDRRKTISAFDTKEIQDMYVNHTIIHSDELQYMRMKYNLGMDLVNNTQFDMQNGPAPGYCKHHPESELALYCENCDLFMCTKCLVRKKAIHQKHEVDEVKTLYERARKNLDINQKLNDAHHASVK